MRNAIVVACVLMIQPITVTAQQSLAGSPNEHNASSAARTMSADDCTYDRCSLRFTLGFGTWSIVQGAESRKVGRLGMFRAPNVENLVKTVPEAVEEARRFQRGYARSSRILWGGAVIAMLGSGLAAGNDEHPVGFGLSVSGLGLMAYGAWSHGRSFNQLSRAVWLYNRSLDR